MKLRAVAVLWAGMVVASGPLGCSAEAPSGAGPAGGAAGVSGANHLSAGASGVSGASGGGIGGASGGSANNACLENPIPQRTQGTLLSLSLQLVMAGKPFLFGQPNTLADGGTLVPLNLRFYISEVELLRGGGEPPIAVDVVTAAGAPEPYGVHLFNAEEADSGTLRLLAPAGEYTALRFALGIKLGCNQQRSANLTDPLSDASQMTWPHSGGFLFLRYEGRYTAAAESGGASGVNSAVEIPPSVHMGGDITKELVPKVTVSSSGTLSIPENGRLERRLSVMIDEIFKGATSDIDLGPSTGLPWTPHSEAGERLRRELSELHVFVLEP